MATKWWCMSTDNRAVFGPDMAFEQLEARIVFDAAVQVAPAVVQAEHQSDTCNSQASTANDLVDTGGEDAQFAETSISGDLAGPDAPWLQPLHRIDLGNGGSHVGVLTSLSQETMTDGTIVEKGTVDINGDGTADGTFISTIHHQDNDVTSSTKVALSDQGHETTYAILKSLTDCDGQGGFGHMHEEATGPDGHILYALDRSYGDDGRVTGEDRTHYDSTNHVSDTYHVQYNYDETYGLVNSTDLSHHDAQDRLVDTEHTTYDENGRVTAIDQTHYDANQKVTAADHYTYTYDDEGQLATSLETHLDGNAKVISSERVTYHHDADGVVTDSDHTQLDAKGRTTGTDHMTYDLSGHAISLDHKSFDASGHVVAVDHTDFDALGHCLSTDHVTYDGAGHVIGKDHIAYDQSGLATGSDHISLDMSGKVIGKDHADYHYDAQGRLISADLTHFDGQGHKVGEDHSVFDALGHRISVEQTTFALSGLVIGKEITNLLYDATGRVAASDCTHYDAQGVVTGKDHTSFQYTQTGQVTGSSIQHYDGKGHLTGTDDASYDGQGRQVSADHTTLDAAGHVIGKDHTDYKYDSQGHLSRCETSHYDGQNHLTGKDVTTYSYVKGTLAASITVHTDAAGKLLGKDLTTYEYDSQGHLLGTETKHYDVRGLLSGRDHTDYRYDAQGNLISSVTTRYDNRGRVIGTIMNEIPVEAGMVISPGKAAKAHDLNPVMTADQPVDMAAGAIVAQASESVLAAAAAQTAVLGLAGQMSLTQIPGSSGWTPEGHQTPPTDANKNGYPSLDQDHSFQVAGARAVVDQGGKHIKWIDAKGKLVGEDWYEYYTLGAAKGQEKSHKHWEYTDGGKGKIQYEWYYPQGDKKDPVNYKYTKWLNALRVDELLWNRAINGNISVTKNHYLNGYSETAEAWTVQSGTVTKHTLAKCYSNRYMESSESWEYDSHGHMTKMLDKHWDNHGKLLSSSEWRWTYKTYGTTEKLTGYLEITSQGSEAKRYGYNWIYDGGGNLISHHEEGLHNGHLMLFNDYRYDGHGHLLSSIEHVYDQSDKWVSTKECENDYDSEGHLTYFRECAYTTSTGAFLYSKEGWYWYDDVGNQIGSRVCTYDGNGVLQSTVESRTRYDASFDVSSHEEWTRDGSGKLISYTIDNYTYFPGNRWSVDQTTYDSQGEVSWKHKMYDSSGRMYDMEVEYSRSYDEMKNHQKFVLQPDGTWRVWIEQGSKPLSWNSCGALTATQVAEEILSSSNFPKIYDAGEVEKWAQSNTFFNPLTKKIEKFWNSSTGMSGPAQAELIHKYFNLNAEYRELCTSTDLTDAISQGRKVILEVDPKALYTGTPSNPSDVHHAVVLRDIRTEADGIWVYLTDNTYTGPTGDPGLKRVPWANFLKAWIGGDNKAVFVWK